MPYYRRGSFTLQKTGFAAGEPDESYCLHTLKPLPDLVIEVVIASGLRNKLALYQALQIPEVWLWENDDLQFYCLIDGAYHVSAQSYLLPDLRAKQLAQYVTWSDQFAAVLAFEAGLSKA